MPAMATQNQIFRHSGWKIQMHDTIAPLDTRTSLEIFSYPK